MSMFSFGNPSGAQASDFGKRGDRELYVDNLHVYREWRFGSIGPVLTGLAHQYLWNHQGWSEARCYRGGLEVCDQAPSDGCRCGFYGWYLPDRLWNGGEAIFGAAEVAGVSVLGGLGLRCARMRPIAIALPEVIDGAMLCPCGCGTQGHWLLESEGRPDYLDRLEAAIRRHLPEVAVYPSKAALLEAHPPSDWPSIVGPVPTFAEQMEADQRAIQQSLSAVTQRFTASLQVSAEQIRKWYLDAAVSPPGLTPKKAASQAKRTAPPRPGAGDTTKAYGPEGARDRFGRRGRG